MGSIVDKCKISKDHLLMGVLLLFKTLAAAELA